jgi:hypothetical protein
VGDFELENRQRGKKFSIYFRGVLEKERKKEKSYSRVEEKTHVKKTRKSSESFFVT